MTSKTLNKEEQEAWIGTNHRRWGLNRRSPLQSFFKRGTSIPTICQSERERKENTKGKPGLCFPPTVLGCPTFSCLLCAAAAAVGVFFFFWRVSVYLATNKMLFLSRPRSWTCCPVGRASRLHGLLLLLLKHTVLSKMLTLLCAPVMIFSSSFQLNFLMLSSLFLFFIFETSFLPLQTL